MVVKDFGKIEVRGLLNVAYFILEVLWQNTIDNKSTINYNENTEYDIVPH